MFPHIASVPARGSDISQKAGNQEIAGEKWFLLGFPERPIVEDMPP
jgi:hypothetical protein